MADKQTPPTPVTSVVRPQAVISGGAVRRRKLKVVLLATLVVIAIGIFLWWYIVRPEFGAKNAQPARSVAQQQAFDRALELEYGVTADEPIVQANQLAAAGTYYVRANEHDDALKVLLLAQKVVDDNKLDNTSQRYYALIAKEYAATNKKQDARSYYDREIKFLEEQSPVDDEYLTEIKKERAAL